MANQSFQVGEKPSPNRVNILTEAMTIMANNKEEKLLDWKLHCIVALIVFQFIFYIVFKQ